MKFLQTRHGRIWTATSLPKDAKGLVLSVSGSGEYRTIGQWATLKTQQWLHRQGLGVCQFDKYGCGESEGDWGRVTYDILKEVCCDLIIELAQQYALPVVYYGQSEGSKLGFEVALEDPGAIGYVLKVPSHQEIVSRIKYQLGELSGEYEALANWLEEIEEIQMQSRLGDEIKGFMHGHARTYWLSCLGRKQPGDLVPSIQKPLFVLNGNKDRMTPMDSFYKIHDAIRAHSQPPSLAKIYPGVGHSLTPSDQNWEDCDAALDIVNWMNLLLS